jgi:(2Fe-2S) ferredoxin
VSADGGAGAGRPAGPPKLPPGRSPQPQRPELSSVGSRTLIFVCHGPSCSERGSHEVCRVLRERVAAATPTVRRLLRVCETTCLDSCATGPNVVLGHDQRLRTGLVLADVERFLEFVVGGAGDRQGVPSTPGAPSEPGAPTRTPTGT